MKAIWEYFRDHPRTHFQENWAKWAHAEIADFDLDSQSSLFSLLNELERRRIDAKGLWDDVMWLNEHYMDDLRERLADQSTSVVGDYLQVWKTKIGRQILSMHEKQEVVKRIVAITSEIEEPIEFGFTDEEMPGKEETEQCRTTYENVSGYEYMYRTSNFRFDLDF